MSSKLAQLASQMDALYEYDREEVIPGQFKPGAQFAGLFAGEHVAGTEFVIGAFFVIHGVRAADLLLGLLIGNLLAVLSWTFICAPIATRTRLTLYWYLRRIAGPGLTVAYNVANAVLFCILAGAMIAVSATAVGLALGIKRPGLDDVLPPSVAWVALTFAIGTAFIVLAILGFEKLSRFAEVCSPWMFAVFIAGALAMLPRLGVHTNLDNLKEIAQTRIWTGVPSPGQEQYHLWHIIFFAWFCNLASHFGLSDMALFRYARHWAYGLYSAFGMYPGHTLAWICSGVMVAAVNRQMDPGVMAFEAAGFAGLLAVVLASWTTANPTLYRAGLAIQCITPNWPRWKTTLMAGLITTILSCFPLVFMKLLNYVAIYGLVLMPIGAIVFAEHWIFPKFGIEQYVAEKRGWTFNWKALVVWVGTLVLCLLMPFHLFFRWLPGYFVALVAYIILSLHHRKEPALDQRRAA
jgi:purine-cytosine permease-like protein